MRIWIIRPKFMKLIQYLFPDNFFRKWSGAFTNAMLNTLKNEEAIHIIHFKYFNIKGGTDPPSPEQ